MPDPKEVMKQEEEQRAAELFTTMVLAAKGIGLKHIVICNADDWKTVRAVTFAADEAYIDAIAEYCTKHGLSGTVAVPPEENEESDGDDPCGGRECPCEDIGGCEHGGVETEPEAHEPSDPWGDIGYVPRRR